MPQRRSVRRRMELVVCLRKGSYHELVPDPSDGRAKLVRLTDRGWKVHATLVQNSRAFERECARSLAKKHGAELRALLEKFAAQSRFTR